MYVRRSVRVLLQVHGHGRTCVAGHGIRDAHLAHLPHLDHIIDAPSEELLAVQVECRRRDLGA